MVEERLITLLLATVDYGPGSHQLTQIGQGLSLRLNCVRGRSLYMRAYGSNYPCREGTYKWRLESCVHSICVL